MGGSLFRYNTLAAVCCYCFRAKKNLYQIENFDEKKALDDPKVFRLVCFGKFHI